MKAAAPSRRTPPQRSADERSSETFRADLEELLPFVATTSSFPRPLAAPAADRPARQDSRRTRLSLAIFGAMLLGSAVPLLRYARSREAPSEAPVTGPVAATPRPAERARAPQKLAVQASVDKESAPAAPSQAGRTGVDSSDPVRVALLRAEADLPASPAAAADQLLQQGLRELSAGRETLAEALLAAALKRDDDNPRAYYGLARIRLAQGNVEGAEGWIVSAVRKRPRRPEYHAFYATVLERLGRRKEAAQARARAAQLSERAP